MGFGSRCGIEESAVGISLATACVPFKVDQMPPRASRDLLPAHQAARGGVSAERDRIAQRSGASGGRLVLDEHAVTIGVAQSVGRGKQPGLHRAVRPIFRPTDVLEMAYFVRDHLFGIVCFGCMVPEFRRHVDLVRMVGIVGIDIGFKILWHLGGGVRRP